MSRIPLAVALAIGGALALSGCTMEPAADDVTIDETAAAETADETSPKDLTEAAAVANTWGEDAFITFATDGTFAGNTGCNAAFGDWRADEDGIRFDSVGVTQMACHDGAEWATLPSTATLTATELTLLAPDGAVIAVLPARP